MDPCVTNIRSTAEQHTRISCSNRPILGSLPDSWFNSSSHDNARHESPLQASVEALLLLNSAQFNHASFVNSIISPAGEENVSDGTQSEGIPITAPVPLSYAVRGKEALKSILSIGEEDDDENDSDLNPSRSPNFNEAVTVNEIERSQVFKDASGTLPNIEITALTPGPIFPIFPIFDIPQQRSHATGLWAPVNETQPKRPFIRSISPSTLMALTEPCLMAWCYDPDLDFNHKPQHSTMRTEVYDLSSFPAVCDEPVNMNYAMPLTRNVWGY